MNGHLPKLTIVAFIGLAVCGGAALAQDFDFLAAGPPVTLSRPISKDLSFLNVPETVTKSATSCPCGADCPCAKIAQQVQGDRAKYRYVSYSDGSWKAIPVTNTTEAGTVVRYTQPAETVTYWSNDEPSYGSSGSVAYQPTYSAPVRGRSYTSGYYTAPIRTGFFGGGRIFRGGSCANGQCGL